MPQAAYASFPAPILFLLPLTPLPLFAIIRP
jgi:hypothetical protein